MAETESKEDSVKKVGEFVKTWLPIAVTVGGLITGYFVFRAETSYQFELQQVESTSLRADVTALRQQIEENRREWQRSIEEELRTLREDAIRRDFRIQNLERSLGRTPSRSSDPDGFSPAD